MENKTITKELMDATKVVFNEKPYSYKKDSRFLNNWVIELDGEKLFSVTNMSLENIISLTDALNGAYTSGATRLTGIMNTILNPV